ncbi:hypothetical protein COB11_01230 [Candidatus Aerophobetes bacterium]|uniref:Uncharacterized protein n=1 Tax=Aerophobetes bacterium TaxID=2030807 RepID=A0A2A4YN72_UNCAE|nr:MAG: hypothetical protein COB11_01230 [Candidatus Aerophobetes bacterium]
MSACILYVLGKGVDQHKATLLIRGSLDVSTMASSGGKKKTSSFAISYSPGDTAQNVKHLIAEKMGILLTHIKLFVSREALHERVFVEITEDEKVVGDVSDRVDSIWLDLRFSCTKDAATCENFDALTQKCEYLISLNKQNVFICD